MTDIVMAPDGGTSTVETAGDPLMTTFPEQFLRVTTKGHIDLVLSQSFETVVCDKCGAEYLLFRVLRPDAGYLWEYPDTEPTVMPQSAWDFCPNCGERTLPKGE